MCKAFLKKVVIIFNIMSCFNRIMRKQETWFVDIIGRASGKLTDREAELGQFKEIVVPPSKFDNMLEMECVESRHLAW